MFFLLLLSFTQFPLFHSLITPSFTIDDITKLSYGYILSGTEKDENFGNILSRRKGDFNKDGYNDLLVHSLRISTTIKKITVFFGSPSGLTKGLTILFKDFTSDPGQLAGDFIGDVNHDGIDDIIICSVKVDSEVGPGKCYVIFGSKTWTTVSTLDLTADDIGAAGLIFSDNMKGNTKDDRILFGYSFSGLLDIDGDGTIDFGIGNPTSIENNAIFNCQKRKLLHCS